MAEEFLQTNHLVETLPVGEVFKVLVDGEVYTIILETDFSDYTRTHPKYIQKKGREGKTSRVSQAHHILEAIE